MIFGVILHLENDLPLMVDLEQLPGPRDQMIRCTNVRTVDGKRPSFVNDREATFIIPLTKLRLIEAPAEGTPARNGVHVEPVEEAPETPPPVPDEEPDEDLLARIRDI